MATERIIFSPPIWNIIEEQKKLAGEKISPISDLTTHKRLGFTNQRQVDFQEEIL